jgi:hypothetical protein
LADMHGLEFRDIERCRLLVAGPPPRPRWEVGRSTARIGAWEGPSLTPGPISGRLPRVVA